MYSRVCVCVCHIISICLCGGLLTQPSVIIITDTHTHTLSHTHTHTHTEGSDTGFSVYELKFNLLISRLVTDFSRDFLADFSNAHASTAHAQTKKGCFSRDFSRIS